MIKALAFTFDGGYNWLFSEDTKLFIKTVELELPKDTNWLLCHMLDKFVAVADDTVYLSTDGKDWAEYILPVKDVWKSIKYIGGILIVESDKIKIFSSNGKDWQIGQGK